MAYAPSIPWVEKYRPTKFDEIILDRNNREILNNVLNRDFHVNLLFYGPPGTGKTTTIINMIKRYNERHQCSSGLVMHLNASDDRGIDLIRNQLYAFVNANNLFSVGKKIIVLDEADYMTKMAQHALKQLIEQYNNNNIRFVIICNYITKIDQSLQNIMMHLRFNNLPKSAIVQYLQSICDTENIPVHSSTVERIQKRFEYDVRSMINYMQFNFIDTKRDTDKSGATTSPLSLGMKMGDEKECELCILNSSMFNGIIETIASATENDVSAYQRVRDIFRYQLNAVDVRVFWNELFCHVLKCYPEHHVHSMKIKYFVNNMHMTDEQIITHCVYVLQEMRISV